jgi:hypothetical protein
VRAPPVRSAGGAAQAWCRLNRLASNRAGVAADTPRMQAQDDDDLWERTLDDLTVRSLKSWTFRDLMTRYLAGCPTQQDVRTLSHAVQIRAFDLQYSVELTVNNPAAPGEAALRKRMA